MNIKQLLQRLRLRRDKEGGNVNRCSVLFLKISLSFNRICQQDVLFCFLFSFWDFKHKFHFQEMSTRCPVLFLLLFLKLSLSFRGNVNKMFGFTSCCSFGTSITSLSLLIKHSRFYRRGEFRGSREESAPSHEWQQILLARLNIS